jgi:hypothetical protein
MVLVQPTQNIVRTPEAVDDIDMMMLVKKKVLGKPAGGKTKPATQKRQQKSKRKNSRLRCIVII